MALSTTFVLQPPKRDAARSNRAGDANPPKTLRFRGFPFLVAPVLLECSIRSMFAYSFLYIQ